MKQQLNTALGQASLRGLILLLPILGNLLFLANAKADLADLNVNLIIEVEGLRNKSGQICTTLFNQAEGFPSDSKKAFKSKCIEIKDIPQKLTFTELKPGNYAVALFHDANKNGNLDTNFLRAPKEGFGFSNNPEVLTRPPKFNDSAVTVSKTNTNVNVSKAKTNTDTNIQIKIKMKYFFPS